MGTIKLNCMHDKGEFTGELAITQKEAEKLASQQVLDYYADEIANIRKAPPKKRQRVGLSSLVPDPLAQFEEQPHHKATSAKSELNATFMKISRRKLEKGEIIFD